MIHIILLLILWSQPNPQVQQINFTPPNFTPTSARIDLWFVSEYTTRGENRSPDPSGISFGDKGGEGRCSTTIRLRSNLTTGSPLLNFTHNVPPFTELLGAFDGVDDFAGTSGFTRAFLFAEHTAITIVNPNVLAELQQGRVFIERPATTWVRWSGAVSISTRAKHGARIRVTFKDGP